MLNNKINRWISLMVIVIPLSGFAVNTFAAEQNGHGSHGEEAKGPNGGKLLYDGDITLELAIFEQGVPPEYRAWITHDDKPAANAKLVVTLTRLGDKKNRFEFTNVDNYWLAQSVVEEPHSFDVAVELSVDGKAHMWQWESHEGRVEIDRAMAKKVGIQTRIAGNANIERHLQTFGRLVTPPDQTVQVRARFPGVINLVAFNVGDIVKKGDVLAVVESNESLQTYFVRSPINAVVQTRMANTGETTADTPLFILTNNDRLWAEFKLFPGQRNEVKRSQEIHIIHSGHDHESVVSSITPSAQGEPYVLARAILDNTNTEMAPGDLVSGNIVVERVSVPLAVDNRALHSFRDWTVVFIQVGDVYEIRPLELGRSDSQMTEVLAGLNAGDHYVVENSYLIKADILKSSASHDH